MKITSKQVHTTVIHSDGTYSDMIKKVVSVDATFDSVDVVDIHNAIVIALCDYIQSPSVTTRNMSEVGR